MHLLLRLLVIFYLGNEQRHFLSIKRKETYKIQPLPVVQKITEGLSDLDEMKSLATQFFLLEH